MKYFNIVYNKFWLEKTILHQMIAQMYAINFKTNKALIQTDNAINFKTNKALIQTDNVINKAI